MLFLDPCIAAPNPKLSRLFVSQPGSRRGGARDKPRFSPEFARYVDRRLGEFETPKATSTIGPAHTTWRVEVLDRYAPKEGLIWTLWGCERWGSWWAVWR
jgi:hypothetical protein